MEKCSVEKSLSLGEGLKGETYLYIPQTQPTLNQILSLKITLNDTSPAIWRKVLVPVSVTFFDLHHIIQISMGWKNSHLFEFQAGDYKIGFVDPQIEGFEDVADANDIVLDLLLVKEGFTFTYICDFGDHWLHAVGVEKILTNEEGKVYPECIRWTIGLPTGGQWRHSRLL